MALSLGDEIDRTGFNQRTALMTVASLVHWGISLFLLLDSRVAADGERHPARQAIRPFVLPCFQVAKITCRSTTQICRAHDIEHRKRADLHK